MDKIQLCKVLDNHKLYLSDRVKYLDKKADLSGMNLRDADLLYMNLRDADLSGTDLRDADLSGTDLSDADLEGTNLKGTNLRGADLEGANLSDADLRYANLVYAIFSNTDLRGADLRGADLYGCKGIISFCLGKDFGHAYRSKDKVRVSIGCKDFDIDYWLNNYIEIGKDNQYTNEQIIGYGLQLVVIKRQAKYLLIDMEI